MSTVIDNSRKLQSVRNLPTLPGVARQVLELADSDSAGAEKLTEMIANDQALSVKVLGLANSAYYGRRSKIGTIRQAVVVIGTNTLKQLSLSVLVTGTIDDDKFAHIDYWKHSFGTATASSLIAKKTGISFDDDLCFMAGLLHDVGRMIITTHYNNDPALDHTEIGAQMAQRWQLPTELIEAIAHHHSLDPAHLAQPLIVCVHAADICAKLAFTEEQLPIPPEVLTAAKLTEAVFLEIVEDLRKRKQEVEKFLT